MGLIELAAVGGQKKGPARIPGEPVRRPADLRVELFEVGLPSGAVPGSGVVGQAPVVEDEHRRPVTGRVQVDGHL